jgi:PAS domain S-box-containing protein
VELERRLRASEEALRDLVEASPQGVLIATKEYEPLLANQACAGIFGFESPAEIVALDSIADLIASPTLARLAAFETVDLDGSETTQTHEIDGVRKDGAIVRLKSTAKPIDWRGRRAVMLNLLDIAGNEKAETALSEREAQFGAIVDSAPAEIALKGGGGRDLEREAERLAQVGAAETATGGMANDDEWRLRDFAGNDDIGLEMRKTLGKTRPEVTIEDTAQIKWLDHRADLTARKPFQDFRHASHARDGRAMQLAVSGMPVFGETGNFEGYRGTGTDISAEEERKKSEERFSDFSELGSDWLWEMDENLRFIFMSPEIFRLGVETETFIGKTLEEARHDTCELSTLDEELQVLIARKPYRVERPSISKPGRWLHICGKPLFSETGTFLGYRGATTDITERKRAEAALLKARDELELRVDARTAELRKSNEALRNEIVKREKAQCAARNSEGHLCAIVDNIADGIITIDTGGIVESASASAEKMFGYKAEELLGRNASILVPESDRRGHDNDIRCYIETGESDFPNVGPRVVTAQRKDGSTFPMEMTIGEMPVGGKPLFVCAVRDISKRREAESALHHLSARLISAQEDERSRIARELHDDFNQRLALLAVDLERLHHGLSNPQESLAEGLASLLRRTKELSSDIHRLSHQLHPSILQHLGLVAAARSFCKEISEQHDVHVELAHHEIPRSLPSGVALCLYRIIQEALRNVIKHSGAANARVEITKIGSELKLHVSDDGIGFDPESDRTRRGLGLLSMRERLRQVDGSISIMRVEPTGTRIDVRIPFPDSDQR